MKTLKKAILATAATAVVGTSMPAMADLANVEANVGVTSNYLWRGVTQSSNSASVSGGLDWSNDSGIYVGGWVGSLGDDDSGFNGAETDIYFGWSGDVADGVALDVGYIYYLYSEQDDADFSEIYASVAAGPVEVGVAYTVDSQVDETDEAAEAFIEGDLYVYASASTEVAEGYTAGITIGSYMFDDDGEDVFDDMDMLIGEAEYDYTHYAVSLTKSTEDMGEFTFTINATDADEDDISAIASDKTNVVVSWGTTL